MVLLTRARIRIVKRTFDKKSREAVPQAVNCGLNCPGPEEMAVYIECKLSVHRQAAISEHLNWCPACFALYVDAFRFLLEHEEIS